MKAHEFLIAESKAGIMWGKLQSAGPVEINERTDLYDHIIDLRDNYNNGVYTNEYEIYSNTICSE